jgi:flagellin-specific chaperone FliS
MTSLLDDIIELIRAEIIRFIDAKQNDIQQNRTTIPTFTKTVPSVSTVQSVQPIVKDQIIQKLHDVIQQLNSKILFETRHNIDDYFTNINGILTPKMVKMNLNGVIINIPEMTLVNHSNVNLKEIKCKFKTDAYNLGVKCNQNFDIETEIVFGRDATNDGYSKINELLIKEHF